MRPFLARIHHLTKTQPKKNRVSDFFLHGILHTIKLIGVRK